MKVVVAIDSLKGSLSSMQAGYAIKEGILKAKNKNEAEVVVKPLADGGEGTTDALIEGLGGEKVTLTVTGPYYRPVEAYYGIIKESGLAVMEMAQAAGITLEKEREPLKATTYGVGEMIADAITKGCRKFIIGIGGSATNDGGIGMLKALGATFTDANGSDVGEGAGALGKIATLSLDGLLPELKECEIRIACDVNNPLCGENGATYIYGPQKGITEEQKSIIDADMAHYADVVAKTVGKDYREYAGAGAAGGLGFAFLYGLYGILTPGIELILNVVHLEDEIKDADVVVTGEGRLDAQTAMGKAPAGVAKLAKKYGCKVVAFAGAVTKDARLCNEAGIDAFFPILREITTLEEAMEAENARNNILDTVEQVFRLL